MIHPWPDGDQFAFVLTHDVETADGMRLIAKIADMEEELGFRSSWNIVPNKYPIDRGLVADLVRRGFEIGIHGYNHDGRLFWSARTFRRRAEAIRRALREYECVGFRAPMVHRNLAWMQTLEIEYDASCFDVDPFQAMPGGIGSLWPLIAGRFVELPYTLPQDHTLLIALGETTDRIWRDKLDYIRQQAGMALMLTHPDYLDSPGRRVVYRQFLDHVAETGGYWHALPRDVASWWKDRDRSTIEQDQDGPRIHGPAGQRGRIATLTAGQHGAASELRLRFVAQQSAEDGIQNVGHTSRV